MRHKVVFKENVILIISNSISVNDKLIMNNEFGASWTEFEVVYSKTAFQNLRRLAVGKYNSLCLD
jgi:hypothetical protein